MELNKEEIALVTKTFYQIMPISEKVSERFYQRLFEIAPHLEPLFVKTDMRELRKKLIDMIALVVHSLDNFPKVEKALHSLGERHARYGVERKQYDLVGEALLYAFSVELGAGWTAAVEAAWLKTYQIMTDMATAKVYAD